MNKVSIIIPVYNASSYIEKCVKSVLKQTYKNIEIILINDGSTDNSLEIIKKISKENEKVKYYNQKNIGVAKTRNNGIKYSSGEYIMFIDNDDYIDSDYVENFVKALDKDTDYVFGGYRRVDLQGNTIYSKTFKNKPWSYYMFVTPWGKIYKKRFLIENNIEFLPVKMGEDIYFTITAISYSTNHKIIDYIGYNWLDNSESVSNTLHKKNNNQNKDDLISLFKNILKKVNKKYIEENKIIIKYFFLKTIIWYIMYSGKGSNYQNTYINYKSLIKWISNNIEKPYKGIITFNPKGETIKVKFIVKLFVFLDKIHLLKLFLKIYCK